jgi:signal transduction histidine kinase
MAFLNLVQNIEFFSIILLYEEYLETIFVFVFFFLLYLQYQDTSKEKYSRLQKRIFNQEKIDSIQLMAAGLAHDYNNIIQYLQSNIDLMWSFNIKDNEWIEMLNDINSGIEKITNLTKKISLLSEKSHKFEKKAVNITGIIKKTIQYFNTYSGINVKLVNPTDFIIPADKTEISRVFQNILINSKQAMNNQGEIIIKMQNTECVRNLKNKEVLCKYLLISIQDNGCGIPKDKISKIFDPFYTTKDSGKGLGLAIVNNIVHEHNGYIEVESELNVGTTFKIFLSVE